jgi:hypothetical protein
MFFIAYCEARYGTRFAAFRHASLTTYWVGVILCYTEQPGKETTDRQSALAHHLLKKRWNATPIPELETANAPREASQSISLTFPDFGFGTGAGPLEQLELWNAWNCVSLKRLERSEAVDRLERLELVAAWVSDVPNMTRPKMAIRARHRLCLRATFSLRKNPL